MERYIIARHFINNKNSLIEFEEEINKIIPVLELLKIKNLNFGLKLTTEDKKLTKDLKERIKEQIVNLPSDIWLLYDPKDRGPGTSFRQIIFNPTFSWNPNIITSIDLDQFPLEENSLEPLLHLIEKVEKDNSLYGIGSRNIPIKLAIHKRNSDLRIIHELFHSLTIGSEKLVVIKGEIDTSNVIPAYKEIGESTTGISIFNTNHKKYIDLMNNVNKYGSFRGFATEYYTAIRSSQLGKISTGYVIFKENNFYEEKNEEDELKGVKRLIEGQTKNLGKTDIKKDLLKTLEQEENTRRISKFYYKNDVEIVRDLMMNAILSQN